MVIKVIWSQDRVDMAVTMEETTMLMEMGTPKNSSTPNTAKKDNGCQCNAHCSVPSLAVNFFRR